MSGLYQLPFGRGRRFGAAASSAVNAISGDGAISSGYTFHSGAPIAWGNMLYYGGDLHYDARRVDHTFDTPRFKTASAQQLSQNFRYFPSQFNNLRVDATNNLNLRVTVDFALREKLRLQFRAESFNLCNHALFAAPSVTPASTALGAVSSTINTPRIVAIRSPAGDLAGATTRAAATSAASRGRADTRRCGEGCRANTGHRLARRVRAAFGGESATGPSQPGQKQA